VWYGFFVPARRAWPDGTTDLDNEYMRYGLYERRGDLMIARFPETLQASIEVLLRPMIFVANLYDRYLLPLRDGIRVALLRAVGEQPADVTVPDKETFNLTPAQRRTSLDFWRKYMGAPGENDVSAYRAFTAMAHRISARGSKLVILDLPIPAWHRNALPYDSLYHERAKPYFKATAQLPGVRYLSLREGFRDNQFYDSVHPRPRASIVWADRLYAELKDGLH
jgi:hypothetical protein